MLIRDTVLPSERKGLPYIGLKHISEGSLTLNGHGYSDDVTTSKYYFQKGDILFGKLRPYFRKVIKAPFNGICSTDIWVVRPTSEDIDIAFLYYLMASEEFIEFASSGSVGTRMPRAKWDYVSRFEAIIPTLAEQQAIAQGLSAMDNKIKLNQQMSKTLDEMARALFKSWFVDFDPVRAKMDDRWRPGQSLPGLPARYYDIFPDRLVSSELGDIPEGWEIVMVGDLAKVVGGTTPSTKQTLYWRKGIHFWATPKDLASLNSPVLLETNRKITDAGLAKISSGLLPSGTVLMSSRAPIGYLAINGVPTAINQGFIAMLPHKNISKLFLLYWSEFFKQVIITHANGSTFLEINKTNFRQINLVRPKKSAMIAFDNFVRPLYDRIKSNEIQNRTLVNMRDGLLPKLLSGEIRINDKEDIGLEGDEPQKDR